MERVTATQAGANLAIVQATLRVVVHCLLAVFLLEVAISAGRTLLHIPPNNLWFAVARGALMAVLLLPIFYQIALRPVAEAAGKHAAAAAEARFGAIAQAVHEGILIFDVERKIIFANAATERMYGYPAGALPGKSVDLLMPPGIRPLFTQAIAAFLQTSQARVADKGVSEQIGQRSTGERFPVEISVSELAESARRQFVAVMRDISARKQIEREIQERTTRLNALIANSPLAIVVLDQEQRVQMCNPAFEELFQYRSAEVAGMDIDSLVAPPQLMCEAQAMTGQGMQGKASHAITRRRRRDATLVDVEIHGVPLVVDGHVEGAYALYQDLTERRQLEETARESELRYQDIFHYANDAIVIFRPDDEVILDANPAAAALYGYPTGELVGLSLRSFTKDVARGEQTIEKLLKEGSRRDYETVHFRKDGQAMTLICSGSLITYQGIAAVMSVMHDITERKRAELAMAEAERNLRKILEAIPLGVRIIRNNLIAYANPADARLHGFDEPVEEVGMNSLLNVAEEETTRMLDYAARRAAGQDPPRRYTSRRRRRDGTEFPAQLHAERILYGGEQASLLVIEDLTDQNRLRMYEQILPVCCVCGKIRDDAGVESGEGAWDRLDHYITKHSDARLSHTFCPPCLEEYRKREGLLSNAETSPQGSGG